MPQLIRVLTKLPHKAGEYTITEGEMQHRWPVILRCPLCGKLCNVETSIHMVSLHKDGTFTARPAVACPWCTWKANIVRSVY